MVWGKAGSDTLTSASASAGQIITGMTGNKFVQGLHHLISGVGTNQVQLQFSEDTGNNYAERRSSNGGTDSTLTSTSRIRIDSTSLQHDKLSMFYCCAISTEEKLVIAFSIRANTAGAGYAPQRTETVGKWVNTVDQLDAVKIAGNNLAIDTNLTILGSDMTPAVVPFVENVPDGSRFEETDTRKFYTKDLNGWKEKGTALEYRYASTYEQINPLTTVNKQHFVEWFSGKQLPSYWSQENTAGTGTFAMVDAVDEGFSITTTSGTSNRNAITFNQIDPFAYNGSVFIAVARRVTSANAGLNLGFSQDDDFTIASGQSWAVIHEDTATGTHKALQTRDGSSHSQTLSSVPIDTAWTNYKLALSSDAKLYINGSLEITKTTNLPTVKLQPAVRSISRAGNTSEIRVRYLEAYNT